MLKGDPGVSSTDDMCSSRARGRLRRASHVSHEKWAHPPPWASSPGRLRAAPTSAGCPCGWRHWESCLSDGDGSIGRLLMMLGVVGFKIVVNLDCLGCQHLNEQLRFFKILEYTGRYGFPEILIEVRAAFLELALRKNPRRKRRKNFAPLIRPIPHRNFQWVSRPISLFLVPLFRNGAKFFLRFRRGFFRSASSKNAART